MCAWPVLALLTAAAVWLALGGPGPVPIARSAPLPEVLVLSNQARRVLALQYRPSPTELMGCMIGEIRGDTVTVERIAPADVDPSHSTATHVVPDRTCEQAGWAGTVGTIHTHPTAERCWYFFPGTQVVTSDGQSFMGNPYPVDAILCGNQVVWISRRMVQKHVRLGAAESEPKR
jgi:uncharacterized cupin superfamily protein